MIVALISSSLCRTHWAYTCISHRCLGTEGIEGAGSNVTGRIRLDVTALAIPLQSVRYWNPDVSMTHLQLALDLAAAFPSPCRRIKLTTSKSHASFDVRMQGNCTLWPMSSLEMISWLQLMTFLLHLQQARYSVATKYILPKATTCLIF